MPVDHSSCLFSNVKFIFLLPDSHKKVVKLKDVENMKVNKRFQIL